MNVVGLHRLLLGQEPSEDQSRLYVSDMRGYLGKAEDEARVIAVFTLALALSQDHGVFQQVLMIVPAEMEVWLWSVMRRAARTMFAGMPSGSLGAKALKTAIEHILLGSKLDQFEGEPERWVSYGLTPGAQMPEWMAPKLLV